MKIKMFFLSLVLPIIVAAQEPMARSEVGAPAETSTRPGKVSSTETLAGAARELEEIKGLIDRSGQEIGNVRLTVKDWKGEPVARDVFIKLEVKCAGQKSFKTATPAFNTCAFMGLDHDRGRGALVIRYQPPMLINGRFGCDPKVSEREIVISCKN
jgi:hypothetical protein